MTTVWDKLRKVTADQPPRILIYGLPGIGKTTLASEFPKPVFIQIEDGTPGDAEFFSFGKIETFAEFQDALSALYTEDHDFQTVVIDSVTELQKLVIAETCAIGDDEGKVYSSIEEWPYGNGYRKAMKVWEKVLSWLDYLRIERGMTVVLIAHVIVGPFRDPESAAYDQYQIALRTSDKTDADHRGLIERAMDAIILLKRNVVTKAEDKHGVETAKSKMVVRTRATGGDTTVMCCVGKPAYTAKNRYGMPPTIRYDKGNGYAVLAPYFPKTPAPAAPAAQQKEAA